MWPQSQNNGIFRGQVIGPPLGVSQSQFTYLGKIEVPVFSNVPSNDLAPESSKKRKAESMGQPGNEMSDGVSQSVSENCWLNEFHEHHKFGGISEMNVQVNNQRVFSNQPFPGECSIEAPQPARHQSNSQNSLNTPISEGTFHNTAVQNLNNFYSRLQPPSFHQQGPSTMINSAAMNIPTFHDMQYTEFNKSSQIDASKPPYPYPGNMNMEGAHVGNFPRNDVNSGGIYSVSIGKLSSPRKPSESVRSSEMSYLQNEKSDHFVELNGTTHVQDMSKTGSSFKWNHSGQSIDSAEAKDISRVRMDSLGSSECSPMNERDQSYEVRTSIAPDNVASANGRDQSFGDRSIQLIEDKEKSNMGAMTHSEEVPPKNDTEPSWYLNGKRTVVDKLWDGFVQLNSSTTVSAVAFFKSGEKAPEINWSKSIEVKGKVRLEAFEKFIQELPRSRSRGLMVISLCWKVGSSETGLTGMKEVAKAYKQGRRVGYAQPSAGIDLYVCPRSDTIITILAKYGFFKGMAAVEDDQDSLIGCVVWRRKHSSSDSVSTKGETKSSPLSEQPLYTCNTVIQETADAHTPLHTELVGGSIPLNSQKKSAPPSSTGNNHNQISTVAFYPQDNSVNLKPTLSSDSTSRDNHMKAEMKTLHLQSSEQGKYGFNSEIPRPVLPVPLQNINVQSTPAQDDDDDDDLPEFDFSFACGVSRQPVSKSFSGNNAHVLSAPLKKNVPAEGAKNANGLIPSTIPVASQQSPSLPPTSNTNPPSLPPKEINQGQSPWHGPPLPPCPRPQYLQLPEQHHGVAKVANSTPQHPPKNHLWDDDDDMPEWCPPDFEHGKQRPSVTNARTSVSCAPTPAPNPTSEKLPPGPSWGMPPLPHPMPVCPPVSESLPPGPPWRMPTSPPSMPVRPPLPTQGFPTGYQNLPVKPPQVRPVDLQTHIGARPPSVPAPDPTLRPQANMFDMGPSLPPPHMRPAGWRGWRP